MNSGRGRPTLFWLLQTKTDFTWYQFKSALQTVLQAKEKELAAAQAEAKGELGFS